MSVSHHIPASKTHFQFSGAQLIGIVQIGVIDAESATWNYKSNSKI